MDVRSFAGYRFVGGTGRDVSRVVAPPYDQISEAAQAHLYALSAWNIVRVSLPRDEPDADRYAAARRTLDAWLADGVWARETAPAIYPYQQIYTVAGRSVTRTGFVALGEVSDYAAGVVRPHERTHAGPKRDRMRLLEATAADIGLLFMLVADPDGELRHLTAPMGDPVAEARDLKGEVHRLWCVRDAAVIARVQAQMAPRTVIIADGHHRYETAVAYARRHPAARQKLMAFFALEAPGLTILPNHRLVHGLERFEVDALLHAASRWFAVSPLADPLTFRPAHHAIGVVARDTAAVLRLRADGLDAIKWPDGVSRTWRSLAVSVLHEGILKPLLDITDEKLEAGTHVDYTADQAEAVRLAREGGCQAAFLIAPTTPEELQAVVQGGELLPQKSTHFYPKLLDGLVFHRVGE